MQQFLDPNDMADEVRESFDEEVYLDKYPKECHQEIKRLHNLISSYRDEANKYLAELNQLKAKLLI